MKRHKLLPFLVALLLLGSCSAVSGDDEDDASDDKRPVAEATTETESETPSETPSPTEEATVAEPTPQQVWVTNHETNRSAYAAALATALALRPKNIDAPLGALRSCQSLEKQRNLNRRVAEAQTAFVRAGAPTYEQALAAITATATTICPEFATFHETQVDERAKRLRAEERRRKEQRRRPEAREAREQRQREREEQEEQDNANVYYANCTAVESAGAAPIYVGDPGYSTDLDRDGDGVACEQ